METGRLSLAAAQRCVRWSRTWQVTIARSPPKKNRTLHDITYIYWMFCCFLMFFSTFTESDWHPFQPFLFENMLRKVPSRNILFPARMLGHGRSALHEPRRLVRSIRLPKPEKGGVSPRWWNASKKPSVITHKIMMEHQFFFFFFLHPF